MQKKNRNFQNFKLVVPLNKILYRLMVFLYKFNYFSHNEKKYKILFHKNHDNFYQDVDKKKFFALTELHHAHRWCPGSKTVPRHCARQPYFSRFKKNVFFLRVVLSNKKDITNNGPNSFLTISRTFFITFEVKKRIRPLNIFNCRIRRLELWRIEILIDSIFRTIRNFAHSHIHLPI